MQSLIQSQKITLLFLIPLAFTCVAVSPGAFAVIPPPDGGYPGLTTAEGSNALKNLTTGSANTGLGWFSLFDVTTGKFNTGVGAGTLVFNTADSNTAVGAAALFLNTTGTQNVAVGTGALVHNDTADQNTAAGALALSSHVSGNGNTALGANALFSDATGQENTAIGAGALFTDNNGFNGSFNTAVGASALALNTSGDNTAVGNTALFNNTSGHDNTGIGISTLSNNTTGSNNIALGSFAGSGVITSSNVICIGVGGADTDNSCFIGSIFGQTTNSGSAVFIDANNKLGTLTSSKRFKKDIQAMDQASDALFALKPVTFHYKKEIDPAGISQFGLVAEDVEKVNPDLVVRDKEGKPYSVRYDQVNAMLLNEFLKEHKKVQQLQATVAQQQKDFQAAIAKLKETVTAQLIEQAAQIQKVSAQIELSKPAPQTVKNND
jgi:hypothetical protein